MVGPTILEYGTEEQVEASPGICSGKVRWCLGLSEPNAIQTLRRCKPKQKRMATNG